MHCGLDCYVCTLGDIVRGGTKEDLQLAVLQVPGFLLYIPVAEVLQGDFCVQARVSAAAKNRRVFFI